MDYWYILFVRTGSEEKVRQILSHRLDSTNYQPFVPVKTAPSKSGGVVRKMLKPLYPGYIFIQSVLSPDKFCEAMFLVVYPIKDAYRVLHNGSDRLDTALRENERLFFQRLFGKDFIIEDSIGVIKDGKTLIISGPLAGMEGMIKKIDRHRREATVEISIMGEVKKVTLGLEIVEKS